MPWQEVITCYSGSAMIKILRGMGRQEIFQLGNILRVNGFVDYCATCFVSLMYEGDELREARKLSSHHQS